MQIRCNFPDISYLSETQKNNFQFLNVLLIEDCILRKQTLPNDVITLPFTDVGK